MVSQLGLNFQMLLIISLNQLTAVHWHHTGPSAQNCCLFKSEYQFSDLFSPLEPT